MTTDVLQGVKNAHTRLDNHLGAISQLQADLKRTRAILKEFFEELEATNSYELTAVRVAAGTALNKLRGVE